MIPFAGDYSLPPTTLSRPLAATGRSGGFGSVRSGRNAWHRRPGCLSCVRGQAAEIASKTSGSNASAPNFSARTASR